MIHKMEGGWKKGWGRGYHGAHVSLSLLDLQKRLRQEVTNWHDRSVSKGMPRQQYEEFEQSAFELQLFAAIERSIS